MLVMDRLDLKARVMAALEGVGDRSVEPVWQDGEVAIHCRMACTLEEEKGLVRV